MINHARTLLLNRSGGNQTLDRIGEEYIPTTFNEQTLPNWLSLYWHILFGSKPENVYANYQVARLLRIIHSTDYAPYLYDRVGRITYNPDALGNFSDVNYGLTLINTTPIGSVGDYVTGVDRVGDLAADEVTGVMQDTWDILFDSAHNATATNRRTGDTVTTNNASTSTSSLSSIIALPNTDMSVRLTFDGLTKSSTPYGATIESLAQPVTDLTDTFTKIEAVGAYVHTLFGSLATEPYKMFYELWNSRVAFPDRVAGFVLAMIYQMDTLHRAGTN